jgi:SAM-dependent methyltransferase
MPALYRIRIAVEKANYHAVGEVHELPPIFDYWSSKHLVPKLVPFGFRDPDEFFVNAILDCCLRSSEPTKRFVSIGAGNCDAEARIARRLIDIGRRDFLIECLDVNPSMLARGIEHARAAGVQDFMTMLEADFNFWRPAHGYDGVIANQSLHHVLDLEHLFESVDDAIGDDGKFIVYDMIGRNGHMRWPEALEVVRELWSEMPASHRYNRILRRQEKTYEDWDCSVSGFEGVRAQDILPLMIRDFRFEVFIAFSNVVEPFVGRAFGPNFTVENARDRDLIDRVEARDELEIRSGNVKPTSMFAILGRNEPAAPTRCIDHLTPQFCVRTPA